MAEAHKINDGLYVVPLGDGKVQLRTPDPKGSRQRRMEMRKSFEARHIQTHVILAK